MRRCFSALQRAENSSIRLRHNDRVPALASFSALQRAENSSIQRAVVGVRRYACVSVLFSEPKIPQSRCDNPDRPPRRAFQCSSASRKFLNRNVAASQMKHQRFQCSSASRKFLNQKPMSFISSLFQVSVLFSEPKIPQYREPGQMALARTEVSVLFSEPKIPQLMEVDMVTLLTLEFQCSSASRKFLNLDPRTCVHPYFRPR